MKNVIIVTFDHYSCSKICHARIIRRCIDDGSLKAEHHRSLRDQRAYHRRRRDSGRSTRPHLDKPTDVLSFPMFQLIAGEPPTDWTDFQDPETGLVPLGDMCISLERAIAQAKRVPAIPPAGEVGVSHHPLRAASAGV